MDLPGQVLARALLERTGRELKAVEAERLRLRGLLPDLARVLRSHGARDAILFGSLAWGAFHEASDVDVAVSGIDYATSLRAMSNSCDLMGLTVEVLRLEDLPEGFRRRFVEEGERL